MKTSMRVALYLCLNIANVLTCYCQKDDYDSIVNSIENKVKIIFNHNYFISGIDIDKSINNSAVTHGKIKDPYHTLTGCFLFLAEGETDADLNKPKGFIGLYRCKTDSIIWRSVLLSNNFSSGALGSVEETNELNGDGKVEIIIRQFEEPPGTGQLWIFNWDGTNGKLITQLDSYGESVLMYSNEDYSLIDLDGDGIYEIQGEWYSNSNSETKSTVTYSWNGALYGEWGKSSKYLIKGGKQ
jgi:hypothetical protein